MTQTNAHLTDKNSRMLPLHVSASSMLSSGEFVPKFKAE